MAISLAIERGEFANEEPSGRCGLASEDVAHSLMLPIDDKDRFVLKGLMERDPAAKKVADGPCPVMPDGDAKK
jgi:D-serine deaminase-like pyridoxal phosphate-dependent protein